jgi:hypothetical protein
LRKVLIPLALAVAAAATPAHAEQVRIGVNVADDWSATAYGSSTKPGESFGGFQIVRVSATDSTADPHVTLGGSSVPGFAGSTTGTATYVVNAHPMNGTEPSAFAFTAVVVCAKVAGDVTCAPSVGEHTVISAVTGP